MNPAVEAQPQPLPLLVWIDVETTGLDPDTDCLLELAVVLTGPDLVPISEPFSTVITPARPEAMAAMGQWVRNQHSASGLLAALDNAPTLAQAESAALEYIARHAPAGTAPLAGSSVGFDRSFLVRHMPALAAHLHYRTVDVSTIRELAMRWFPATADRPSKAAAAHRALPDILASIAELAYWRRTVFAGRDTDAVTAPDPAVDEAVRTIDKFLELAAKSKVSDNWAVAHIASTDVVERTELTVGMVRTIASKLRRLGGERDDAEHNDLDTCAVQQILTALPAVLLKLPLKSTPSLSDPVQALADAANKLGDRFGERITDLAARDGRGGS